MNTLGIGLIVSGVIETVLAFQIRKVADL